MASVRRRFYQEPLVGVHSSEMLLTLELVNLTSADAGLYTLVATNKYGSQSCSAVVDVLGKFSVVEEFHLCKLTPHTTVL